MPTIISHALLPISTGFGIQMPRYLIFVGALSAILPDIDTLGFYLGIPYAAPFGHRGFTHSILFALIWGFIATFILSLLRNKHYIHHKNTNPAGIFLFVFWATLSHPLLDMLTAANHGVALFFPYNMERLTFPWRPILGAPLHFNRWLTNYGKQVLFTELRYVVLPCLIWFIILYSTNFFNKFFYKK